MREDMFKVIVEKPRRGGHGHRKGRALDIDDMPKHEGMKKKYGSNRKELNENLNPLERFLKKQVGRPWNKVYSEICKNLSTGNAVQQHVKEHIRDFVHITQHKRFFGYERAYPLFVDPKDGILKKSKKKRK